MIRYTTALMLLAIAARAHAQIACGSSGPAQLSFSGDPIPPTAIQTQLRDVFTQNCTFGVPLEPTPLTWTNGLTPPTTFSLAVDRFSTGVAGVVRTAEGSGIAGYAGVLTHSGTAFWDSVFVGVRPEIHFRVRITIPAGMSAGVSTSVSLTNLGGISNGNNCLPQYSTSQASAGTGVIHGPFDGIVRRDVVGIPFCGGFSSSWQFSWIMTVSLTGGSVATGPGLIRFDAGQIGTPAMSDCPGDIDDSGSVDLPDLSRLLAAFGATLGDASYDAAADLDFDGEITLSDLAVLLARFGEACV